MSTSRSLREDDHAGFDRPRRRTKPRTKQRPDYSGAPLGRVIAVDRGRYRCQVDDRLVTAVRGRLIPRKGGVIVGDLVRLDGDVSEEEKAALAELGDRLAVPERPRWHADQIVEEVAAQHANRRACASHANDN